MSSRKFVYDVDSQDTVLSNAFSRNVTIEEPEDSYNNSEILSTNTLKRQPRVELERTELVKMLTFLEGKLQASDICIASLKSERVKSILFQARHGKHGLNDPIAALARDHARAIRVSTSELRGELCSNTDDEEFHETQLSALDNLITAIRDANQVSQNYRYDLQFRLDETNDDLETCIQQQQSDTLQADNVTFMLEKEKEQLIEQLNHQKSRADTAEKAARLNCHSSEEAVLMASKHKAVALALLSERRSMHESLAQLQVVRQVAKTIIKDEKTKSCKAIELNESYLAEIHNLNIRLEEEKKLYHDLDRRNHDLQMECSQLKTRVDLLQRSAGAAAHISRVLAPATVQRNFNAPRQVAPPVPPNKPVVYIPNPLSRTNAPRLTSTSMLRHATTSPTTSMDNTSSSSPTVTPTSPTTTSETCTTTTIRALPLTTGNVLQRPGVPLITSSQHTKTLLHR